MPERAGTDDAAVVAGAIPRRTDGGRASGQDGLTAAYSEIGEVAIVRQVGRVTERCTSDAKHAIPRGANSAYDGEGRKENGRDPRQPPPVASYHLSARH